MVEPSRLLRGDVRIVSRIFICDSESHPKDRPLVRADFEVTFASTDSRFDWCLDCVSDMDFAAMNIGDSFIAVRHSKESDSK